MHQRRNKIRNHVKTLRSAAIILVLCRQNKLAYQLQNTIFIADIISNMWLHEIMRCGKFQLLNNKNACGRVPGRRFVYYDKAKRLDA